MMRPVHQRALEFFYVQMKDTVGSPILRKAKLELAERQLLRISRQPTSDLIVAAAQPAAIRKVCENHEDVFEFIMKRVCAELDLRIPVPSIETS